jgi:hypothetical protein
MTGIQELIHKLEEGEWVKIVKLATGILALTALTVWYDFHEYRNVSAPDAMEAAQLARNLASGKGYTTQCIRPLTLRLVEKQQGVGARLSRAPHPDLASPPVYPLILAGLMKVVPFRYELGPTSLTYQPEMVIALLNQGLFFLAAALFFFLARRLFDDSVAVATVILLLGSDVLWKFSVSGLSTMLLLVLLAGLCWSLVLLEQGTREPPRGMVWFVVWAGIAGLALGVGALTRYSFGWLLLPALVFCAVWLGPKRLPACGVLVAVFLLVVTPWLVRNHQVSGTFFGVQGFALHQETPPFPDARLERSLDPDLAKIALEDYFRKLLVNGSEILQNDLPKLGGSWVTAFFLVGLLLPFRSPTLGRVRLFLVMALAVLAVVQALGHTHLSADSLTINSENLLVLMAPLVFMFGAGMFFILLDQVNLPFPEARRFIVGTFLTVGCGGLIFTLLPPRTYPVAYPPYLPPWVHESARLLQKNELMMSDMPWAVAWYGDRACVWTTLDVSKDFYSIYDDQKAVSGLYLTPLTTDARILTQVIKGGPDWVWGRFAVDVLLRTNLPTRFPLRDARSRYIPDQLLLFDRPRWKEPGR